MDGKKYGLRCRDICTGIAPHCDPNCIDHIKECPMCQDDLALLDNIYDFNCVACGDEPSKAYRLLTDRCGHIASGFFLCEDCYRKFFTDPKDDMKSAIEDFIKKINRKEVSHGQTDLES